MYVRSGLGPSGRMPLVDVLARVQQAPDERNWRGAAARVGGPRDDRV